MCQAAMIDLMFVKIFVKSQSLRKILPNSNLVSKNFPNKVLRLQCSSKEIKIFLCDY